MLGCVRINVSPVPFVLSLTYVIPIAYMLTLMCVLKVVCAGFACAVCVSVCLCVCVPVHRLCVCVSVRLCACVPLCSGAVCVSGSRRCPRRRLGFPARPRPGEENIRVAPISTRCRSPAPIYRGRWVQVASRWPHWWRRPQHLAQSTWVTRRPA